MSTRSPWLARSGRTPIDRTDDRRVTIAAIGTAIAFLLAAVLAAGLPEAPGLGAWLPLHLALAGGAGSAIAGVMPFFTAAITVAPPVAPESGSC